MVGDRITIRIEDHVTPTLRGIAERAGRLRPVLAALGQMGVGAVQANFAAEGRPAKWAPLRRPRPNGRTAPVLTDTGRLRHSVFYRVRNDGEVAVGTNVEYAAAHNQGCRGSVRQQVRAHERRVYFAFGRRLRRPVTAQVRAHARTLRQNIPARPFLVVPADDQREMERTVADWIIGKSGEGLA